MYYYWDIAVFLGSRQNTDFRSIWKGFLSRLSVDGAARGVKASVKFWKLILKDLYFNSKLNLLTFKALLEWTYEAAGHVCSNLSWWFNFHYEIWFSLTAIHSLEYNLHHMKSKQMYPAHISKPDATSFSNHRCSVCPNDKHTVLLLFVWSCSLLYIFAPFTNIFLGCHWR